MICEHVVKILLDLIFEKVWCQICLSQTPPFNIDFSYLFVTLILYLSGHLFERLEERGTERMTRNSNQFSGEFFFSF